MTKIQCKDISDLPILDFIAKTKEPCNWFGNEYENSVTHAMPDGVPDKLVRAKMASLIRRKLVNGCACGCRGDFTITELGKKTIAGEV